MAFAALLPYLSAGAAAYGAVQQANAKSYDAAAMRNEQQLALNQGTAQANLTRRETREQMGKQLAAFGAAGTGYGGSSEIALDQSAVNSELDALNARYKGTLTGYGYGVQANLDDSAAREDTTGAALLAGGSLLKSFNKPTYSFGGNATPAQQAGVVAPQP